MEENGIIFDIGNLMAGIVKEKINSEDKITEKVKILLELIDFENSKLFTDKEKNEISCFYRNKTHKSYEVPTITGDVNSLILEYAETLNDITKTKKLINNCLNDENCEEAVADASEEIEKIKARRNTKLFDKIDLDFANTANKKENKNKKTQKKNSFLDNLLSDAKKKAYEINASRKE